MKKIVVFLMLVFFAGITALYAQSPAKTAKLVFDHEMFDFGQVPPKGGTVSHEFGFVNKGDAPLVFTRIETSCTCTKGVFPKKPVMPGERGVIRITFDPKTQKGIFFKAIQVYSNAENKRTIVTVKGEVK